MKVPIFFSTVALVVLTKSEKTPIVEVPNLGKIEGGTSRSLNGHKFYTFEGVPYAQPPVGKYRFKEPVPPKPWTGTWQAKTIYKCMQYNQYAGPNEDPIIGDEDCLYLNIYTPSLDPTKKLDVIIYIHGGAFMFLYGAFYGPLFLMDKDVVFVNFNYRLGPLGFLSTENDVVPGNNGIKDQILALQWIKKNIKYFGGNPDSVTIFGMSAGGASVHLHYLSPKSRGLYHRGMSQSGTTLNPWVLMEQPLEKTKKLASDLGCGTEEIEEMVDCLKSRPARQIVGSVKIFLKWLYNPFSSFGVVVDSWASDPVLPEHPYILLKNGQVNDLPYIISRTDFEGLYPASDFLKDERYIREIDGRWHELMPHILDYNYTVDPKFHNEVGEKIRKRYLGGQKLSKHNFVDFVNILSNRLFDIDIQKTAKLQSSVVKSPLFFYLFVYKGAHYWYDFASQRLEGFGAAHAEDTAYLLSTPTADVTTTEEDKKMVHFFVDMMVSFAKYGVPKTSIEWKPISKDGGEIFGVKIESADKLSMEKVIVKEEKFWESLPIMENEKKIKIKQR